MTQRNVCRSPRLLIGHELGPHLKGDSLHWPVLGWMSSRGLLAYGGNPVEVPVFPQQEIAYDLRVSSGRGGT